MGVCMYTDSSYLEILMGSSLCPTVSFPDILMQFRGTHSVTNPQYVVTQIEGLPSRDRKIARTGSALQLVLL
eukprot:3087098-Rhodomonas_salina.1